MLPKKERLKRVAFNQFFSCGKRYHSPSYQLIYSAHDTFHASVVVSKKIEKEAVQRNKMRRRVYDILRNLHKESPLSGIFIILTKKTTRTASYEAIKTEARSLITQTKKVR